MFSYYGIQMAAGLGPKRRESSNGDRVNDKSGGWQRGEGNVELLSYRFMLLVCVVSFPPFFTPPLSVLLS